MLRLLQNILNFSDTKLPPASDITLLGIPYYAVTILNVDIRLSADKLSIFLPPGICYGSLQCISNFYYLAGIHLCLLYPIVSKGYYDVWFFIGLC